MNHKQQKSKSTYLQRIQQKVLVPWDSFSDFTYRFRDRVHRLIHGDPYVPCPCTYKPAVLRNFMTFEDLIVAEKRRIGWKRSNDPAKIAFYYFQTPTLEPASSAHLTFDDYFKNQVYYEPNKIFGLHFIGDNDWCQIDEDKNSWRKLRDGRIIGSVGTTRRAIANTNGVNKMQTTWETFFLWTDGHVHDLTISGTVRDKEWDNPESKVYSVEFIEALGNRPISTIMLKMDCRTLGLDLNSKFCTFILDYVDFKMFSLAGVYIPQQKPYEIPEKLMKCEFLYLDAPLANSEIICQEFKGWGLVIKNPDSKLGFNFFNEILMNWYNLKRSQWRYLSLACDIPDDKWNSLTALGKEVKDNPPENIHLVTSEIEITREDGEKCRIYREDKQSEPTKVVFYFGKDGRNSITLSEVPTHHQ